MQIADFPRALGLLDDALASATTADRPAHARSIIRGHANFNLGNYAAGGRRFRRLAGRPDDAQGPR